MARRPNLHEKLSKITTNVYFQPPQSVQMKYPCIRYALAEPEQKYANDMNYKHTKRYEGVVIDRDPNSDIPDTLRGTFPMFRLGKPYPSNNLNHFPFTLYY